jgi:hypothetical protein
LVSKFDKTEINPRRECWFLVSAAWMKEWVTYMDMPKSYPVGGGGVSSKSKKGQAAAPMAAPGPISNLSLYADPDGKKLKDELMPKRDYRGVNPTLWFIFVELYGKDKAPELCRYTMDAYAPAVVGMHREQATRSAMLKARSEVAKMRESFLPSSEDESVGGDEDPICCCFYKSHVEFFLFHLFTCCRHLGKKGPAYTALSKDYDAEDDELGMESEEEDEEEEEVDEAGRAVIETKRAKRERKELVAKEKRRKMFEAEEKAANQASAEPVRVRQPNHRQPQRGAGVELV